MHPYSNGRVGGGCVTKRMRNRAKHGWQGYLLRKWYKESNILRNKRWGFIQKDVTFFTIRDYLLHNMMWIDSSNSTRYDKPI